MRNRITLVVLLFSLFQGQTMAFTFKIATLSPDGSFWMQKMRAGAEQVSAKTDGRVKFKFYPGGVMGDDKGVLRKMRFGQLHGAALTSGGLSTIFPDIQLYSLLLKFNNLDEIDYVRAQMDQQLMQGLEDNGIVTLGFAEIGLAYIMATIPIHSIDDMRNQKAWVPDDNYIALAALEALSVSPIPLPIRDVLMGLQTGMINVVAGSPIAALALQWHTKVKYATDLPLSYIFGVFAINKKAFNKISEADQQVVREIMIGVAEQVDKQNRKDNIAAMAALKNQGIEFIDPTPEAAEELRRLIASANEKLKKTGKLTPQMVNTLDKHIADFRAQQAVQ